MGENNDGRTGGTSSHQSPRTPGGMAPLDALGTFSTAGGRPGPRGVLPRHVPAPVAGVVLKTAAVSAPPADPAPDPDRDGPGQRQHHAPSGLLHGLPPRPRPLPRDRERSVR